MLLKMTTLTSETTHHSPGNTTQITPFEGCDGGAVAKDSAEHADALHQEFGADPASEDQQNSTAAQQQLDLAALLSEISTRKVPSEALQQLIQQVGARGQLSINNVVQAVCSSFLLFSYKVCLAGFSARHVSELQRDAIAGTGARHVPK